MRPWRHRHAVSAIAAGAVLLAGTAPQARAYGWPLKPFAVQHVVRGYFGDPRTVFRGPPTLATIDRGRGSFAFHNGIDISAPAGTPVYAVTTGTTRRLGPASVAVFTPDVTYRYEHVRPAVADGVAATAYETVIGHVNAKAGHLHFTEIDGTTAVNPLAPGHLSPYSDPTRPHVRGVEFRKHGTKVSPLRLSGKVTMIADAYDLPALPVQGNWAGLPVTPALVTWRIVETRTGRIVVGDRVAADFRFGLPPRKAFWNFYARGTYQNMPVFRQHYGFLQPGCFLFKLTREPFDMRKLWNEVFDLVVTASDTRGNSTSFDQRFAVREP